jgi:hypothetical protein
MLRAAGYIAMSGQIVDSSLIAAPVDFHSELSRDFHRELSRF